MINDTIKIVSHNTCLNLLIVEQAALNFTIMKQKMFAFVVAFFHALTIHLIFPCIALGLLPHTLALNDWRPIVYLQYSWFWSGSSSHIPTYWMDSLHFISG